MNSTRTATLGLWATLACMVGFGTFVMKNQVQTLEGDLKQINQTIQDDIKTIHILKAEWSHLNSPSRLRQLSSRHISLNPVKPEQIINYSAIPFEYEVSESDKRAAAQKNINLTAQRNKSLKQLVKAER